jgi:hypothetical protein
MRQRFDMLHVFALVSVLAATSMLMVAAPAHASSFGYQCVTDPSYGCVRGAITAHGDVTKWDLTVKDNRPGPRGVYAKVVINRANLPDQSVRSQAVGPRGGELRFQGGPVHSPGTRGARVEVCRARANLPDGCKMVHYEKAS